MKGPARKQRDALLIKAMEARNDPATAIALLHKAAAVNLKAGRRPGSVLADARDLLKMTATDPKPMTPYEAARTALILNETVKPPAKRARLTEAHFEKLAAKLEPQK